MRKYIRVSAVLLSACLLLAAFAACAQNISLDGTKVPAAAEPSGNLTAETTENLSGVSNETTVQEKIQTLDVIPEVAGISASEIKTAVASGIHTQGNSKAEIDHSNTADGYVMIRYTGTNTKVKVLITGPGGVTYTYNLSTAGNYEVFPLSDGSGTYNLGVYENISGTKYSVAFTCSISAELKDEFAPFLLPNQYVNYSADSKTVAKAAELTAGKTETLKKIEAIYNFVISEFTYDYEKAKTVKSGYLPVVDEILEKKCGICFDYAAVMTAMLRSQGIPTKLVVGYTGNVYHAWISTWNEESGWIDAAIYFDGVQWKLMDPTFASTGNSSPSILQYIGNGANYQAKYLY